MIRFKKMLKQDMPIFLVDQLLTTQGFRFHWTGTNDHPCYSATIRDSSTQLSYRLKIPVKVNTQSNDAHIGQAFIEKEQIPLGIRKAAESKLYELTDYLAAWNQWIIDRKKYNRKKKINSMVHDFEDAERLGKIMDGMKTNQIIEEKGQIPDPIQ